MLSRHRSQVAARYSPSATSSLLAPAVRSAARSSTITHPASSGSGTSVSSNITRPRPVRFTGAHGITCFCPLSAMAANHGPRFGPRRNARIAGFSPLLALL
jgi:hypothetical protein